MKEILSSEDGTAFLECHDLIQLRDLTSSDPERHANDYYGLNATAAESRVLHTIDVMVVSVRCTDHMETLLRLKHALTSIDNIYGVYVNEDSDNDEYLTLRLYQLAHQLAIKLRT